MGKCVFGGCEQVRFKPACSATEASKSLETLDTGSIDIILSKQRTTKALICGFVVRIWHKSCFLMTWLISLVHYIQGRETCDQWWMSKPCLISVRTW